MAWALAKSSIVLGLLLLAVVAGLALGVALAPNEASGEFYSAAAGTIPVLLLTLGVQARFFEFSTIQAFLAGVKAQDVLPRESGESEVDYRLRVLEAVAPHMRRIELAVVGPLVLALLIVGEFAALHPLASGRPADRNAQLVYQCLASGFMVIVVLAVRGSIKAS